MEARSGELTREDHERIAAAIRQAEARTAGEIYCVVARASADYFFAAAFFATVGALAGSLLAAWLAEIAWIAIRLPQFILLQVAGVTAVWALLWFVPSLRLAFVPRRLRYWRAHENALRQFYARNVHITQARTGVLLFVSLAERYATVIADEGINRHVEQGRWNGIVGELAQSARRQRLAEGFVAAVEAVGALLATHVPPAEDDRNELDDHVVEI